jgi:hypothetical protein
VPEFAGRDREREEALQVGRQQANVRLFAKLDHYDPQMTNDVTEIISDRLGFIDLVSRYALAVSLVDYFRENSIAKADPTAEAPAPATRNRPVQARSNITLTTLRRTAIELYNDPTVGRDRITTQMVSQKSGCSIGTVYRYWKNRVSMLDDIAPNRSREVIVDTLQPEEAPQP